MKKREFALLLGVTIASLAIVFSACKKLNDATELGGNLIPAVDNITTFETTLPVESYNDIFALINDSTRSASSDEHFLGKITSDPIFGATDARLYLELKPSFYPFYFKNINVPPSDSLFLDSVVLVLDYIETYGDTTIPQTFNVYEMTNEFKFDSSYYVNRNTFTTGALLGTQTVTPSHLKDSIKAYLDTTSHQLRIPLSAAFGKRLLDYDSNATQPYHNDSIFRTVFKGFEIRSEGGGNAIMGFNLGGANTKLAIYYKYRFDKTGPGNIDTAVSYFNFTTISASANYIKRTPSATVTAASGPAQDPILYLQNSPGTFATIKIPGLDTMSNKLIHRAELVMEQIADPSDTLFPHPSALMLDAYDPVKSVYRTIPYDLQADGSGGYNLASFGTTPQNILDPSGKVVKVWRFNLSRYVQHVLTHTVARYDLRLFAPYYAIEQYGLPPNGTDVGTLIYVNPTYGKGRVRLGGGNHPTQRMRLRIIYSKI